jgi:hypothetical protein
MTIDIGPNLLTLLELVVPSLLALVAAYYARLAAVHSAQTNGHVAQLMSQERVRQGIENENAQRITAQNKGAT